MLLTMISVVPRHRRELNHHPITTMVASYERVLCTMQLALLQFRIEERFSVESKLWGERMNHGFGDDDDNLLAEYDSDIELSSDSVFTV